MQGKRLAIAIGATVAVLGLVGGAWGGHRAYSAHQACQSIRDYERSTGAVQHVGSGPTRYVVLGDSYSTGDALQQRSDAWTFDLSRSTGSRADVVAQGGTGFVNAGFCGDGSYGSRASAIPDTNVPLLIEGGLNDVDADPGDVRMAAADLADQYSPSRTVLFIGPVDAPSVHGEAATDAAIREAASAHGAKYISALEWDDLDFGPDGKHLSPSGHRSFAQHVQEALEGAQS